MHSLFVVKLYPWFVYVCSQPGPGTVCCGSRSWASTTWKFCQLICLMTPCMSARRQMLPWGPGGPNSLSSVCLCASVSLHMTMGCTQDVFDSNCALFLLQSPQTTQWLMGVRRYCWMQGSPTTWAVCLEGQSRPPWSSGSKMVYLWRGLTASL